MQNKRRTDTIVKDIRVHANEFFSLSVDANRRFMRVTRIAILRALLLSRLAMPLHTFVWNQGQSLKSDVFIYPCPNSANSIDRIPGKKRRVFNFKLDENVFLLLYIICVFIFFFFHNCYNYLSFYIVYFSLFSLFIFYFLLFSTLHHLCLYCIIRTLYFFTCAL